MTSSRTDVQIITKKSYYTLELLYHHPIEQLFPRKAVALTKVKDRSLRQLEMWYTRLGSTKFASRPEFPREFPEISVTMKPFSYVDSGAWYPNFCDYDMTQYYRTGKFNMSEVQILESPVLAHLLGVLDCVEVVSGDGPTPVLITNVQRQLRVDTTKLYGDKLQMATDEEVLRAVEPVDPPQVFNVYALGPLGLLFGGYTLDTIELMLNTTFTAFNGIMSTIRVPALPVVHAGCWTCGVSGGNAELVAIVQFLSTWAARLQKIELHCYTDEQLKSAVRARDTVMKLRDAGIKPASVSRILFEMNFKL